MTSNVSDLLDTDDGTDAQAPTATSAPSSVADLLTSDDSGPAKESVRLSGGIAPDHAAKILRLRDQSGMPSDFVSRNAEKLQNQVDNSQITPEFSEKHPELTGYLGEDPNHAAIVGQDLHKLGFVERQFKYMTNQAKRGLLDTERSVRWALKGVGFDHPENNQRVKDIEDRLRGDLNVEAPGPISSVFGQAVEATPALAGAIGAGAVASLAKVPATPAIAAAFGTLEFGNAYSDFSSRKDDQGNPKMSDAEARGFALLSGVGNGLLFTLPVGQWAKKMPGLNMIGKEGLMSMIESPVAFQAIKKFAAQVGEMGLVMGGFSGVGALIHSASGHLGEMKSDGSLETASPMAILTRILPPEDIKAAAKAAASGTVTGAVFGGVAGGAKAVGDYRNYTGSMRAKDLYYIQQHNNAVNTAQGWKNVGTALESSKIAELAPEQVEKLVSRIVPDSNVFIPLEQWQTYWQEQKVDPRAAFMEVNGNMRSYDEAMRTGTDLQMPAAKYAAKIAPTEHNEFFSDHLRSEPLAMNAEDAKASFKIQKELESEEAAARENITEAIAPAGKEEAPAAPEDTAKLVSEDVNKQLLEAGFTREEAASQSKLYEAGFKTMGERAGIDPLELYQRYGLKIRAGGEPVKPGETQLMQNVLPEPTFFSAAARAIDQKMPVKAPGKDILGILKNTPGIKEEELNWIGLPEFLAEKKSVTKEEVQEFMRQNQVEIKEVKKEQEVITLTKEDLARLEELEKRNAKKPLGAIDDDEAGSWNELLTLENIRDKSTSFDLSNKQKEYERLARQAQAKGDKKLSEKYWERSNHYMARHEELELSYPGTGGLQDTSKFSAYQLPGGENYKEILMTLRGKGLTFDEQNKEMKARGGVFQSSHFDEPNILAHVRFNDRVDAQGNKVLFLEEVQSDWHQQGREKGYSTQDPDVKRFLELDSSKDKSTFDEYDTLYDKLWEKYRDQVLEADPEGENLAKYLREKTGSGAIPDAPFKKTWHELAMKRMLRYAADNGYDKIAWTTGEQQAARYDLSQQIKSLNYQKLDDGTFKVSAEDKNGRGIMLGENVSPDKLMEIVGKDAAQKIIAGEGERHNIGGSSTSQPADYWNSLTGVDLKVGGEGMKVFYDQMLPSFMNKYAKKWGGRVSESEITAAPYTNVTYADSTGNEIAPPTATVHSIEVTPSMKESVTGGQPLFQGGSENPIGQLRFSGNRQMNIDLLKGSNLSTFLHETGHFYLEMLGDLAQGADATEAIKQDFRTVLEHFGLESREQLKTEHHESWARQFEAYLREGEAPSAELRVPFARFRAWLTDVYKKISSLGVELAPKVRAVFDRLLATDEQIKSAEMQQGIEPLFADPVAFGMKPEKAARYRDAITRAHAEAQDDVIRQIADQELRQKSRAWLNERESVEKEVEKDSWQHKEFVAKEVLSKPIQTKAAADELAAREMTMYRSEMQEFDAWKEILKSGIKPSADVADELKQIPLWMRNKEGRGYDEVAQEAREKHLLRPDEDIFVKLRELRRPKKPLVAEDFVPEIVRQLNPIKLDKNLVKEEYPDVDMKLLKGMTVERDGLSPDDAAAVLGFGSGDELLFALKTTPKRSEWIQEETDQRMIQRHPEARSMFGKAGDLIDEAMDAVHNEKRSQVLRMELEHLASQDFAAFKGLLRQIGRRIPTIKEVRDDAERTIGSKTTADTLPSLYQRAEAVAGREAQEHFLRGDFEKAFEAKQAELFNHELYRAAVEAKERSDKDVSFALKYEKDSARERIGKAGGTYLEQIDAIRAAFDFGRVTLKELGERESLRDWIQEQKDAGYNPTIPPELLDAAGKKSWRQMSNDELHTTVDAMRNIAHLAGLKNKLLASLKERTFDETKTDIVNKLTSLYDITPAKLNKPYELHPDLMTRVKGSLNSYGAWRTRMEPLFNFMGINDLVFEPMNEAENFKTAKLRDSVTQLNDIFSGYSKKERARFGRVTYIPELEGSGLSPNLNKMEMIMTLLNAGNEGNMNEVMRGYKMSEAQLRGIWKHLEARDVKLAQKIWDFIDSYWPEISKQERELNGLPPEKVEGRPLDVTLADGTVEHLKGGYFPLIYDRDVSWRTAALGQDAMAKDMFPSYSSNTATKHNWTKARVGGGGQAPSLKFSVLTNHVFDVIHDLAYRKPIIDVFKILNDPDVQAHIQAGAGKAVYAQMNPWIKRIAGDRQWDPLGPLEMLRKVRNNMTVAELGLKLTSALNDVASIPPAIRELGTGYMARGFKAFADVPSAVKFMFDKSEFMRARWEDAGDRDIRSAESQFDLVNANPGFISELKAMSPVELKDMWIAMRLMDLGLAGPMWHAAYFKSMEGKVKGAEPMDEVGAVQYADRVVREIKGSGATKDLAPIQTAGGALGKLMSMFYSQLNAIDNQMLKGYREFRQNKDIGKLGGLILMNWFLPAIFAELASGRSPQDEEDWGTWMAKTIGTMPLQMMPITREAEGFFERGKYQISPVEEAVATILRTAKNVAAKNAVGDAVTGEESEWTKKDYADAFMSLGYLKGLPTRQIVQSTMRLHGWMSDEEPHDSPIAGLISVITGSKNDR